MHVKAFAMMTRHPVRLEQLPPDLREGVPTDARGRVDRPPREFRAEVFARFHARSSRCAPPGSSAGSCSSSRPTWCTSRISFEYLEWAQEQLRGDEALVEFRHYSWLDEEHVGGHARLPREPRDDACRHRFPADRGGEEHGARRSGRPRARPPTSGCTGATPDVERPRRKCGRPLQLPVLGGGAARARRSATNGRRDVEQAFVLFNNNGRSADGSGGWISQAATNAAQLQALLPS